MKKLVYCVVGLLALAACDKKEPAKEALPFRISPVLTKVTSTSFETGDAIGVSIVRDAQYAYADNQKLTYNGSDEIVLQWRSTGWTSSGRLVFKKRSGGRKLQYWSGGGVG